MTSILDSFPDIREKEVDEEAYRMVVTFNRDLPRYHVQNIALAFALSQRSSDIRRNAPKRRRFSWMHRKHQDTLAADK